MVNQRAQIHGRQVPKGRNRQTLQGEGTRPKSQLILDSRRCEVKRNVWIDLIDFGYQ